MVALIFLIFPLQAYGIPPSSESYMPSYYGQMAFPYMGGPEWSSGNESYLPGYGADTHTQPQHSFMPDAMFGHPSATIGNSAVKLLFYFDIFLFTSKKH